jgi:ABC-type uncharacterized transport system permease subunit
MIDKQALAKTAMLFGAFFAVASTMAIHPLLPPLIFLGLVVCMLFALLYDTIKCNLDED